MMPILTKPADHPATVQCVSELRVGIPRERLADIVRFYAELVGLNPWPAEQQIPGGWGAGEPRRGAYFQFRHDAAIDPMRRRLIVIVPALEVAAARLSERDYPFLHQHGLAYADQCILVSDPVGHLVEIRQSHAI